MPYPVLTETAARAPAYLSQLATCLVVPDEADIQRLHDLSTAFPEQSAEASEVLRILDHFASPATVASAGGRYFGFVTGGTLPQALAASWMVSAWDQNAGLTVMSPAASFLEELALLWVKQALGLPAESAGSVVTGATSANFVCLCSARHELLKCQGWNVENDGLFGAPPIRVVVGDEVHTSLLTALALAGFGRNRVLRVPTDKQGRMLADALPPLDSNTLLCIQAGNVNTGSFDPAADLCQRAREAGAWVHVDGAFGLWAAASPQYAHLTRGFELADSWSTDAHKWPNAGYDCGIAIVRSEPALRAAMTFSAAYIPTSSHRDACHYTPEMSRRARGVELWAALRSLGRKGLAELIERTCLHAQTFAAGLRAAGFQVLNDVVINQVMVSFGTSEQTAMRISVSSWATTQQDVEQSLHAICRIARRITGS